MFLSRLPTGEPEIFATVQGEGPSIGVPSVFVRLAHCNLRCTWCFVPETPILMADWSWRRIGDLAPGDSILGVERPSDGGRHLRLAQGLVVSRSEHRAETVVVNESLRCTSDHRFWLTGKDEQGRSTVHSGWREISRAVGKRALFVTEPPAFPLNERAYERGWLAGMADGDGCFWTLKLARRRGEYRRFRLALQESALLTRAASYASRAGFELRPGKHRSSGFGRDTRMDCLWLTVDEEARRFEEWLARPSKSRAFDAGYLGGILDAEGSFSVRALRVSQFRSANPVVYPRIAGVLERLGVKATEGERGFYLHRSGGAAWRALAHAKPSKRSILRGALGSHPHASRVIRTVEPSGQTERVVTLSTSLGSFIASGFVVKNCDTAYTWDWSRFDREEHVTRRTVDEVVSRVIALAGDGHRNVVITGGEPLLQQAEVEQLAKDLRSRGYTLEIETNGTLEPSGALASQIAQWNVSPKLNGSGNERAMRYKPSALQWFAERPSAYFKFVVASDEEVVEATEMISALHVSTNRVIMMPEGTDPETISTRSRWLADRCRAHGYRLGTRLHLYIWGAERAR